MKIFKRVLTIAIALAMVLSMVIVVFAEGEEDGSSLHPWKVGKSKNDSVIVYYENGMMNISGSGYMKNFNSPDELPWKDVIGNIEILFIEEDVKSIGNNAFTGLGKNLGNGFADLYMINGGVLEEIGDGAFVGAHLYEVQRIPSSVKKIGSKAFADTGIKYLEFWGDQPVIAKDAFKGESLEFYTIHGNNWTDFESQYGGSIVYKKLYELKINTIYDDESDSSTKFYSEGELINYFAESYKSGYGFDHYEVVSGDLKIDDPENATLECEIHDNVEINAVFKLGNIPQVKPSEDEVPCPFELSREDDVLQEQADYFWQPSTGYLTICSSNITVKMAKGVETADASIATQFTSDLHITLDNIHLEGQQSAVSLTSSHNVRVTLIGENTVVAKEASENDSIISETTVFDGNGSLYLTTEDSDSSAAIFTGELTSEGFVVKGSSQANAAKTQLGDVVYDKDETYTYRDALNLSCKTILIAKPSRISPVVWVIAGVIFVAAVFMLTFSLTKKQQAKKAQKKNKK